jgi:sulfite exporter TauE/SafE
MIQQKENASIMMRALLFIVLAILVLTFGFKLLGIAIVWSIRLLVLLLLIWTIIAVLSRILRHT